MHHCPPFPAQSPLRSPSSELVQQKSAERSSCCCSLSICTTELTTLAASPDRAGPRLRRFGSNYLRSERSWPMPLASKSHLVWRGFIPRPVKIYGSEFLFGEETGSMADRLSLPARSTAQKRRHCFRTTGYRQVPRIVRSKFVPRRWPHRCGRSRPPRMNQPDASC